jgi:hypothetical protein
MKLLDILEEILSEKTRDYKDEYKKFQSSKKMRKYRAELNKYNRDRGTYGNGDGKDASHKNGKIAGFESESKNRGRREKSRLKGSKRKQYESILQSLVDNKIVEKWSKKYKRSIDCNNPKGFSQKAHCAGRKK